MKIKTVFILPNLKAGGAERVFSFIPQQLNPDIFDAQILIVGHKKDSVYETGNITVTYLKKNRVRNGVFGIYKFLKKERPNVILGSIGHLNLVLGLLSPLFPKIKIVIREASVISIMNQFSTARISPFTATISKMAYKKADAIICQSNDMAKDFSALYNIPYSKIVQIGNPITNIQHRPKTIEKISKQGNRFITVGRLGKEKGHERILDLLSKSGIEFSYTIVGDGPEEENIREQIRILGMVSKVKHIPHSTKVNELLKANDLFLQGSYVEGFPNAVLESCTVGTPVLAFNVPGGTKAIIESGVNGFMAENEEEFMNYLKAEHQWDKHKIAESVIVKYSPQIIVSKYENLIINLSK